jgi:hypothetical protein
MRTSLKAVRGFMGAISSQRWPAQASARIWAVSSVLFVRGERPMTGKESETVIRRLVEEWVELRGVTEGPSGAPSFSDFYAWLQHDYSPYLEFRSATSVRADVERWFNEELGQDGLT